MVQGHFRKQLLGFNIKRVDSAIEKMKSENAVKQSLLNGEIAALTEENTGLLSQLTELRKIVLTLNENLPAINLAKTHASYEANSELRKTHLEALALLKEEKERINIHSSAEMKKIKREIAGAKQDLQNLLDFIEFFINGGTLTGDHEQIVAVSGKIAGAIIPGKQKKKLYLPKPEEGVVSKTGIEQTGKNMIAPKRVTDQGSKGITGRKWEPAAGEMAGGGPDQGSAAGSGAQLAPVAATRGGDLPAPGGMLSVGNPEKQTGFIADRQEIPVMDQQKTSGTGESENVGLGQISGATDINMEKTRYIAGKISGRDILDSNGQVIVARGETITAEIIDRAEKSGKLPDLIVHMVAPGLNPDWE